MKLYEAAIIAAGIFLVGYIWGVMTSDKWDEFARDTFCEREENQQHEECKS